MKKLFKVGVALALAGIMMVSHGGREAFAADKGTLYAADADAEGLSDPNEKSDHAMYEDRHGYVSLKADGTGFLRFDVNVDTAGKYEIGVVYTAKEGSAARKFGLVVNDSDTTLVNLTCASDWDTFLTYTTTMELHAGENAIFVSTPSDFDDNTVKTPNVYALTYELKEAASTESAGDLAPAESTAGSGQETLPKTGLADSVSFWMLGAVVAFAGAAVVMKKREEA